jgi:hypothetical protein
MSRGAVAVIGDVNYLEHGGMIVFADGTLDWIEPGENEDDPIHVYRLMADRVPVPSMEWFGKDLTRVASYADASVADLAAALNSDDVRTRASAYYDLVGYHGAMNFDESPLELTPSEARKRYRSVDRALARIRAKR